VVLAACATSVPEAPPVSLVPDREARFVLDPLAGYPLAAPAELEDRARRAHAVLKGAAEGGPEAAAADMTALLAADPGFHPARVVLAQIAFSRGDATRALDLLSPVAGELPEYLACQVLLGRAAEEAGDLPLAHAAYRRAAAGSSAARERAVELEPRVVEILLDEIRGLIGRGRLEEAEAELSALEEWWAADSVAVLETRRDLAFAEGDVERETEILERLAERLAAAGVEDDSVTERLADLHLASGDVRAAIDALEILAARDPADRARSDQLERAKFLWRLQLQPHHVQEIAATSVLTRADLATLLYWLVPSVRYAEVTDPPIATDILDHPRRAEILPVIFLDLVPVDEALHRFFPESPATRSLTLASLLGLLGLSAAEFSCLAPAEADVLADSPGLTCRKAAHCGLIPETADCLPEARISGPDALDLFRRTLDLLGSSWGRVGE
jgi:tetratricopeptide (TPR) repeat protein